MNKTLMWVLIGGVGLVAIYMMMKNKGGGMINQQMAPNLGNVGGAGYGIGAGLGSMFGGIADLVKSAKGDDQTTDNED